MLRTYDGKGIQYDRSGNPVSYDGKTFTWNGKQLTKVTAADGSYTEFSYDADGIRTQKRQYKADGEPEYYVNYVWQDGLLTHQSMTYYFHVTLNGTEKIVELPFSAKFVYDESNTPVGCLVNDEAAVGFVRNLQGDIIAVVNQEGTALLEYSYDPWGKVTITHNGENLTEQERQIIAVLCPFAYRGYNYDYTTGLYYLQSRYYNPEWGRFLNVDDTNILLSTQGENLGANLFAYCNNNPVNQVDYTGCWAEDSLPIAVITMLHLVFTNKGKDIVVSEDFINIESGSNAWSGLYKISIDLKTDGALETIVSSLRRSEENTYRALTIFCMAVFENQIGRYFLFSDDCVQHEIEEHIKGFLASNDIKTFGRAPWYMTIFSTGEWLFDGKWLSTSVSDYVLDHCKSVDVAEWDVYSFDDAIAFDYFDGIRRCYHRTKADPYMNALNLRPDYQRFWPVPNDRTEWIRHLMSEGSV